MKSHEQKMHEKKEHEVELERNELHSWLTKTWTRIKTGEMISKRFALIALCVGVAAGLLIYFLRSGKNTDTEAWLKLEGSNGYDALSKYASEVPNTVQGKVARLQVARTQLGAMGIDLYTHADSATRDKAVANVEQAREAFTKLIDEFKEDLTLHAQAIDGAAHAELALVGILKPGEQFGSREYRGSVDKAVELFRRLAKLGGDVAGEPARKMASDLEAKKEEVERVGWFVGLQMLPSPVDRRPQMPKNPVTVPPPK